MLIATRNRHKVGEIRAILGGSFQFLTLNDFPNAPKVVEDAPTFAGNATKKAVELAQLACSKTFQHPTSNISTSNFRPRRRFRSGSGRAGRRARRAFGAVRRPGFGEIRQHVRRRQQRQAAATAQRRSAGKTHRRGFIASSRWFKSKAHSPQSTVHSYLTAPAKAGLVSRRAGKTASATTRCSCRMGFEQTFAELGEDVKNKLSHRAKALEKLKAFLTTK